MCSVSVLHSFFFLVRFGSVLGVLGREAGLGWVVVRLWATAGWVRVNVCARLTLARHARRAATTTTQSGTLCCPPCDVRCTLCTSQMAQWPLNHHALFHPDQATALSSPFAGYAPLSYPRLFIRQAFKDALFLFYVFLDDENVLVCSVCVRERRWVYDIIIVFGRRRELG